MLILTRYPIRSLHQVNFDTLGWMENLLAPVEWETHVKIGKYWLQTWMEKVYMMVQDVVVVA